MKNKILLAEDESDLRLIIRDVLKDEGYEVLAVSNGLEGLNRVKTENPDIVVADVMMPIMDGFSMAREIRKFNSNIPILFLTAKNTIEDIEEGFETGANDYLRKPFEFRELIIRIKALLGKYIKPNMDSKIYAIGNYIFDSASQILRLDEKEFILSNFETKILERLVSNIGNTVDASDIMLSIWHNDYLSNRNSLHGYIHKLRNLLNNVSST